MANLPPDASQDDIEEELEFIRVLILSLDDGADDHAERLAELESQKAELEGRLEAMSGDMNSGDDRPDGSQGPSAEEEDGGQDIDGPFASSQLDSLDRPSGSMKRPRPDSFRDDHGHAAKRLTPEPSNRNHTTVSSSSSDTLDDLTSDADRRAHRRQLFAEAAAARHRQSLADEALARSLSQQPGPFGSNTATSSSTSLASSSSRPTWQTTLNGNGSFQRPPPPLQPEPLAHQAPLIRTPAYGIPQQITPQASAPYVKAEAGSSRPPAQRQFNQVPDVVDLTGNDSDNEDLTEIAPTRFTPNGRARAPDLASPLAMRTLPPPVPAYSSMPGAWPPTAGSTSLIPELQTTMNQNGYQSVYNSSLTTAPLQYRSPSLNPAYMALAAARASAAAVQKSAAQLGQHAFGIGGSSADYLVSAASRMLPYAGYDDHDLYSRRFDELADHNPEKTKEEINALLENIRPDEDIPADLRVKTPEAMTIKLHKYQELGLTWLKACEEGSNKGGILGDEMGLGKTIQMISLIVERPSQDPRCKTTLIAAPVALMRQWAQEIQQKVKGGHHRLNVFIQHGPSKKKRFEDLQLFDIVLTTYGTLAQELKNVQKFELRKKHDPSARPGPSERGPILGPDSNWYRVILDEAQCIKNRSTKTAQAACLIKAKYRFAMTGTPMMNNVEEFFSLVHFLRINPYCRWEKFRLDITTPLKSNWDDARNSAMSKLQALCKAVMLRRTKKSTFEGKPILVLPERTTEVENPDFDEDEKAFYNAIENKTQLQFNKYLTKGTVGTNYSAILVLLLRLRQAACHPHLIRDFGIAAAADITQEEVINYAKALSAEAVKRIKETNGNFECPVCYDAVSNPAIFFPCGHDTCRECFTRITDPAQGLRDGLENGSGAKCPNCRSPIDTKKVTDFDTFKKVHMPELLTEEERKESEAMLKAEEEEEADSGSDSETDSEDEEVGDDVDAKGNLKGFIADDDEEAEVDDGSDDDSEDLNPKPAKPVKDSEASTSKQRSESSKKRSKGKQPAAKKTFKKSTKGKGKQPKALKIKRNKTVTLADLARLSQRNAHSRKVYLRRLRDNYVDSAKIRSTMALLQQIIDDAEGEKVLVFSQWTSLLDLLEIPVDEKGWGYRRYDGSMNTKMRGDAVDDFRDHKQDVRIMLVSLKAGNAGLNLNMASQVIILDPFWSEFLPLFPTS